MLGGGGEFGEGGEEGEGAGLDFLLGEVGGGVGARNTSNFGNTGNTRNFGEETQSGQHLY